MSNFLLKNYHAIYYLLYNKIPLLQSVTSLKFVLKGLLAGTQDLYYLQSHNPGLYH